LPRTPCERRLSVGTCLSNQADLLRARHGAQLPGALVQLKQRQAGELVCGRIEELVAVDGAVVPDHPLAIQDPEGGDGQAANDGVEACGLAVRVRKDALLELEQRTAEDDRKKDQWHRRP